MVILFRTYPFHVHLWIFLVNLVVIIMFYTALRFTIILYGFYRYSHDWQTILLWLGYIRYIAVFTEAADIFCIVCERSFAAKFLKKYEKFKCYPVPILCIVASWLLMSFLVIYTRHFALFSYSIVLGIVFVLSVASAVMMLALFIRIRKARKERMKKWSPEQTLSKRYQMKENIRSSRFLLPLRPIVHRADFHCQRTLRLQKPAFDADSDGIESGFDDGFGRGRPHSCPIGAGLRNAWEMAEAHRFNRRPN
uniref:Uncharacterized protein n=1 Tax=Panagrolaimus sp. JU765 TaxID=591449 RepID=A0AC34R5G0_9BILA